VPFKIRLLNLAKIQIQAWHLPDQILDELYLFLTRVLPADIENNLVRAAQPYNGMIAECTRRDPTVPGRELISFSRSTSETTSKPCMSLEVFTRWSMLEFSGCIRITLRVPE
jgi:hypothetical protein